MKQIMRIIDPDTGRETGRVQHRDGYHWGSEWIQLSFQPAVWNSPRSSRANMWLNSWLLALTFGCGCLAQSLIQSQASITKSVGKTGRIRCEVNGATVSSTNPIHWYQQKPGQPPTRILYFGDSVTRDPGFGNTFNAGKNEGSEFYLSIAKLTAEQSATYYCGYWGAANTFRKIFGTGTKLVVADRSPSAPTVRLFQPKLDSDKSFVACLVTGFFPEVVQIEWKVDNKIAIIKSLTDSVNQMEGGAYSVISRLEVSKLEWEEKTISCHANHEAGDKEASTSKESRKGAHTTKIPKHPECPPRDEDPPESMDEGTSSSSLRVATLTYTLLLMKSVLYCGIISFILYKVEYRDTKKPL